jgi:tetratricopeptide (TPR) repeat protein
MFRLPRLAIILVSATLVVFPAAPLVKATIQSQQAPPKYPAPLGQSPGSHPSDHITWDLVVELRDEGYVPVRQSATVTLLKDDGSIFGSVTTDSGRAQFNSLVPNPYEVKVEAAGFERFDGRFTMMEIQQAHHINVVLKVDRSGAPKQAPLGPPLLVPKAQKELTQGLRELRSGKTEEARQHFQKAAKSAPSHPDVNYLLGVVAAMTGDLPGAQRYFEKAVFSFPKHVLSLTALGEIHLAGGDLAAAESNLEAALDADASCWRAHQLFATLLLRQQSYSEAVSHAERALELGKRDANGARLILAEALIAKGQREKAGKVLSDLLEQRPTEELAVAARNLLQSLQRSPETLALASTSATSMPSVLTLAQPILALPRWTPANVDDSVPPVDSQQECPLKEIIDGAGERVVEFVRSVDRFTATETLEHETLNEFGLVQRSERRTFNYLVSIQEYRPGSLDVQEFRNGSASLDVFPDGIATLGMPSLVLILHPNYRDDFDFECEGLTHQRGLLAWQIHFRQKPDRQGRMRSYRLGNRYFRVGLKGRVWISQDSFHVLRMESDLANQIPDIRLYAEHQSVEYGPVFFLRKRVTLWLPMSTDLYMDYNGHRLHRRHGLSNYLLFSVDDRQQIDVPRLLFASM